MTHFSSNAAQRGKFENYSIYQIDDYEYCKRLNNVGYNTQYIIQHAGIGTLRNCVSLIDKCAPPPSKINFVTICLRGVAV
ncbi:MAG: hypothetical protein B7Z78_01775 [Rhodospirillales bacterium 20-60-12]|nr:MAG: hypothetical protein B7Z78_01775 [Rhodospirillales bacterium 20-60-12]